MSTVTPNFNLVKPELTDPANITAFNVNWDTIDITLKDLENLIDSHVKLYGTYSGNGSTTSRTIDTNCTGNGLLIWRTDINMMLTVSPKGAIYAHDSNVEYLNSSNIYFQNGVLYIATDTEPNISNITYHYQVL